jgi:hypothetical protein
MPLPPLKFNCTGKICPIITQTENIKRKYSSKFTYWTNKIMLEPFKKSNEKVMIKPFLPSTLDTLVAPSFCFLFLISSFELQTT